MFEVTKEILIDAECGKVFDFLLKPSNLPKVWSNLAKISNEKPLPNGGYKCDWQYKLLGALFKGSAHHTDVAKNQWISVAITGTINCNYTVALRQDGHKTRVFFVFQHLIPGRAYSFRTDEILEDAGKELELILARLKVKLEERHLAQME